MFDGENKTAPQDVWIGRDLPFGDDLKYAFIKNSLKFLPDGWFELWVVVSQVTRTVEFRELNVASGRLGCTLLEGVGKLVDERAIGCLGYR